MDTNQLSKATSYTDQINFGENNGFNLNDHWAVRASSTVKSSVTGTYKFRTYSDDGSELFIDSTKVVANGGLHGGQYREGSITLQADQIYGLEASMFEHGGGAVFKVEVQEPGKGWKLLKSSPLPDITVGGISYATWQKDTDQTSMAGIFGIVNQWRKWHGTKPSHCTACACVFGNNYASNHGASEFVNEINYSNVAGDNQAISAETTIEVTQTSVGTYKFFTTSDDGSMLLVDGQVVVNNDGLHGAVERSGTKHLGVGTHTVRTVMFEHGGGANFIVHYQPPGGNKVVMDTNQLSKSTAITSTINFGENNGFNLNDHWAVRASTILTAPKSNAYKFRTYSDDGSELFIDSTKVVANGGLHGGQYREGWFAMDAGQTYGLEASMFEHGGGAAFKVEYKLNGAWKLLTTNTLAPTSAPTPAPTLAPTAAPTSTLAHAPCRHTMCTYQNGKTYVSTDNIDRWHCEKVGRGCKCVCDYSLKCVIRHHHNSGYRKSLAHC
jgi:hypothetical protein